MIDPMPFIRSYVPGRLRLRHPGLVGLSCEDMQALTLTVQSASGITGCVVNPKVGSLLLTWDTKKLTEQDLLGYLQFWAAFLPEEALGTKEEKAGHPDLSEKLLSCVRELSAGKGSRVKCLKVLERRLTALFGVATIASLLKGSSLHARIGVAFTVLLAWHIWKHKRAL